MVKGIEAYGIPVVHVCTVVPISRTIGANRIVPAIGIPYPLGDPTEGEAESYKIRDALVEKAGFPIVQMCNLVPVAKTVGSNRIVPTISIPYPLGDPDTPKEEQWKLRYHRTKVALEALATDIKEQTVFKV